jgi:YaiO family outer membrane protein
MILISTAILGLTLLVAPQGSEQRAEAERMANSGAYAAALKQFQALAAANPDDVDARLWIARLHARMNHPEHAVDVYRSILATQPQHLDALLGLGEALITLGRFREASDALSRAEAIAADRPAVLAAQGRLHHAAHRDTLALAYYLRAVALEPTNAAIRGEADALRAERAHRIEVGYDFQHVNADTDDSHLGSLELNVRAGDALRLVVRGQAERLFGASDQRAGGGIEWAISRRVELHAGALFGADPVFLPQSDVYAGLSARGRHVRWGGEVRHADYDVADLWLIGPALAFTSPKGVEASITYLHGQTSAELFDDVETNTVALGVSGPVTRSVRLGATYTHGIDRLDWLTADRILFESDTLALRARCRLNPFASLEIGYAFQSRPGDVKVHRATAGLTYRF